MRVWKVVQKFDGQYFSYCYGCSSSNASVKYRVGETSVPHEGCGPLAAFRTRAAARAYLRTDVGDLENWRKFYPIFKAEATPSKETRMWILTGGSKSDGSKYPYFFTRPLPEGTVLCDSITLLEKSR